MKKKDWKFIAKILENQANDLVSESKDAKSSPGYGPSKHTAFLLKGTGTKRYGAGARKLRSMAKEIA